MEYIQSRKLAGVKTIGDNFLSSNTAKIEFATIQGRTTTERSFITNMLHYYSKSREKNMLNATFASRREYIIVRVENGCSSTLTYFVSLLSINTRLLFL